MSHIRPRLEVDSKVYLLILQICLFVGLLAWKFTRVVKNISGSSVSQFRV